MKGKPLDKIYSYLFSSAKCMCQSVLWTLIFICCGIPSLKAQKGAPFLHNYYAKDYNEDLRAQHSPLASSKNTSVVMDSRGILYFANEKGILEYDGSHWRIINMPNELKAYILGTNKLGRVFVGGKNEFGYLGADSIGRIRYISLSRKLGKAIEFDEILHIFTHNNDIYFAGNNHLFHCDENLNVNNVRFEKNKGTETIEKLVHVTNWGVVAVHGNIARPVSGLGGSEKQKTKIINIISFDENRVLIIAQTGLFFFDGIKVTPFRTSNDAFMKTNSVTDAVILPDGKFVVGTARGGLAWIGANGIFELILDRVGGLPSQLINSMSIDKESGLWICTDEGITRAEVVSPLTRFEATSELQGSVQSMMFQNNTLYVATSMGLYFLNNKIQKFSAVKGVVSNAWALETLNNHLYAATGFGVYRIKGDSALLVSRTPARSLSRSPMNNKLYVGLYNGLGVVQESQKVVKTKKKVRVKDKKNTSAPEKKELSDAQKDTSKTKQLFGEIEVVGYASESGFEILDTTMGPVKQIAFEGGARAWIYTDEGLRIVSFGKDTILYRGYAPQGLPEGEIRIFKTSHGIVFGTNKGLYRYSAEQKKIMPYHWLGGDFEGEQINYLFEDTKGNVLISKKSGIAFGKWEPKSKKFSWHFTEFQRLSEILVNHVYASRDGAQWIGTERGIIHFDPSKEKNYFRPYQTLLRKVDIKIDNSWTTIFGGAFTNSAGVPIADQDSVNKSITSNLKKINFIRIQFSAPYYEGEAGCLYRHRLIGPGLSSEWSPWTTNTAAEYPINLNGDYNFEVMARNLYDNNSQTNHFTFTLQPQWYETAVAKAIGLVLGLISLSLIVLAVVRFQTARLKRKNEELQAAIDLATEDIRREKQKSENLLLNILPKQIAEELKVKDRTEAQEYQLVSVLFTDFKGFTNVAEKLTPNQLIEELNICFSAFDEIIGKYGIEKIKTIGDAYMCAGGIPEPNFSNPVDIILAGLEIQAFMRRMGEEKALKGEAYWQLRLGIHTGELVAGVVGKKKFAYDIWGDTVNTASRMESSGEPMKVNISGTTYLLVSDFFECTPRGKLYAKNKGDIEMYFVERLKPEFSADLEGEKTNEAFNKAYEQFKIRTAKSYSKK